MDEMSKLADRYVMDETCFIGEVVKLMSDLCRCPLLLDVGMISSWLLPCSLAALRDSLVYHYGIPGAAFVFLQDIAIFCVLQLWSSQPWLSPSELATLSFFPR